MSLGVTIIPGEAAIVAIAAVIERILDLWRMHLESLTPELRAEQAKMAHEDLKAWREFFSPLVNKSE